ncbi:MAG: hypothetical protein HeimC2_32200 [Candidatus Heimdallarchaeota archaeon LC_2]|nr:MAG: hypothetical protein HeimC2_32200 [Candidatus Heimdallarchaeota archaeon LC_2]
MIRKSHTSRSRKNSAGNKRNKRKSYAVNSSFSYCGLCGERLSNSEKHMSASHRIVRGRNTSTQDFELFTKAMHLSNPRMSNAIPSPNIIGGKSVVYEDPTPIGGIVDEIDTTEELGVTEALEELFTPQEGENIGETTYRAITLVVDTASNDLGETNPQVKPINDSFYGTYIEPILIKYNLIKTPDGTITVEKSEV